MGSGDLNATPQAYVKGTLQTEPSPKDPLPFLLCSCFQTLYSFGWLEAYYIDQAGLKLMDICLPLPPEFWE